MGYLKIILGCMFAKKTTELLKCARAYKSLGLNVLIINHSSDTRYGENCIISHDNDSEASVFLEYLQDVNIQDYQVIIIDEGQFFSDLFEHVTLWADSFDIKIIVAGLSGNSDREPFGDMLKLIPHADEIIHLKAQCSLCGDGTPAIYSKFIGDGMPSIGSETYVPVCRKHFKFS